MPAPPRDRPGWPADVAGADQFADQQSLLLLAVQADRGRRVDADEYAVLVRGSLRNRPMLAAAAPSAAGFMLTFLLGGLSGVMLASPPIDFHVHATYFLVAHFHYVLFGTIVFATYAGGYFWFPKMTGRLLDERLGKLHFWLTFIGFHTTFLVQHWLGNEGMPRRYADYLPADGFQSFNVVSTVGASPSAYPCCRSSGTSLRATATAKSPPSMTRGDTATPWSGPPAAHRRGTTSPSCPGSVRSGRLSNCTTPIWRIGCAPKPTSGAGSGPVWTRRATLPSQARTGLPVGKPAHQSPSRGSTNTTSS